MAEDDRRSRRFWGLWSLLGISAWIGATVVASVTNDDPADPGPILRTFAIGGAVFFGITFAAAAHQMQRRRALDAGTGTTTIGLVYVAFGVLTTGLVLAAIGLGEDGPFRALMLTAVALVLVWCVYVVFAIRRLGRGTGA